MGRNIIEQNRTVFEDLYINYIVLQKTLEYLGVCFVVFFKKYTYTIIISKTSIRLIAV